MKTFNMIIGIVALFCFLCFVAAQCENDSSIFDEPCSAEDTSFYGDCRPVEDMTDEEIMKEAEDIVEDNWGIE